MSCKLAPGTLAPNLVDLRRLVFESTARTGQTDGQTDGRTDGRAVPVMRPIGSAV